MKIYSLLALLSLILHATSLEASSTSFVKFSIDKNVFNELNPNQQQAISEKVKDINIFFENDIYPHIPEEIKQKIKDLEVTINFSDKSARDGLFIPGTDDHKHKIVVQLIQLNSNGIKALLAHEFFHAIHFEINPDESTWVREGMAQLFEYITTDELNGSNLRAAIMNPSTPLIGKYDIAQNNAAQYGHNMLYFYYLYKHCGGDRFFWSLAQGAHELRGAYLIDNILANSNQNSPECRNFLDSAVSFEVAKFHNKIQESKETKAEGRERYYLAPTNLTPKFSEQKSIVDLDATFAKMPLYSSIRFKLQDYLNAKGKCQNCLLFYAKRTFPFEVSELPPFENSKNYDLIIVKTTADSSAD